MFSVLLLQLPAVESPYISLRFCISSSSCIQTPRPGKQWAFAALSRADMSTSFLEALQKPKVVFSSSKSKNTITMTYRRLNTAQSLYLGDKMEEKMLLHSLSKALKYNFV